MQWPQLPSDPHQAAVLAASAGLIAGASLVIASRHLWYMLPAPSAEHRSTTSSAGALRESLGTLPSQRHPSSTQVGEQQHMRPPRRWTSICNSTMPLQTSSYHTPMHPRCVRCPTQNTRPLAHHQSACNFASRCALLCERHCLALQDFTGELGAPTALDVGCAVGGATFELARVFPLVVGLDYSQHFVDAACAMQSIGRLPYTAVIEGDVTEACEAVVDDAIDRSRVRFMRGDACNLPKHMRPVDCVLAANLLCRLPQPERFLVDLPRLLKPGGIAVLVSPYSWLAAWTPRRQWLGGFYDASKVCKAPLMMAQRCATMLFQHPGPCVFI